MFQLYAVHLYLSVSRSIDGGPAFCNRENLVPRFPVPRFLPMRFGPSFSSPVFSTHTIWFRVFQSRVFHPVLFMVSRFPFPRFQRPHQQVSGWTSGRRSFGCNLGQIVRCHQVTLICRSSIARAMATDSSGLSTYGPTASGRSALRILQLEYGHFTHGLLS